MYQKRIMRRSQKRTDEISHESAMEEVRAQYEDRQIKLAWEARRRQAYLDRQAS
jgi:hypothetical protein